MRKSARKYLVVLGVIGLMLSAQAQEESQQNQPTFIENQWGIGCNMTAEGQRFICDLSKSIVRADTGQNLLTFVVRNLVSEPGGNEMVLRLPHGINIQAGVKMKVDDGSELDVPVLRTDAQGVLAALKLTDEINNRLKGGNNAVVSFIMINGQTLNVQFSLSGYTKAFNRFSIDP